ncbi:UDP-N-acetylglucosamine--N-acetylmuramyl-(pentapeptide) pyrophosphoryl-undecaprenol N-acetylglucosamine transferase [Candidatus Saccharibacteria bacterium TM7i]|nr:UDP-N-acetylglucosamine--N-acetylmuramyl-(pentapeptide) pyrophosphoryl-undecaprenol N-acetylglucosamine transferase [Candidatus Saccharibacteria bacterium TM7i]
MKILAVGGGSGGHVTPAVAVLKEVRAVEPEAEIRFWCDKKFEAQTKKIVGAFDDAIRVDTIASGKLRRYHHLTLMQHVLWPSLMWSNLVDSFKVLGGIIQSIYKLCMWRPDVIFTKGGFVCLPVGIAAHLLRIPLVVHDSDAHPGLTNRVLARWAVAIGTGAPLEYYNYPKQISKYVGVPVSDAFVPRSLDEKRALKKSLGLDSAKPLTVITGGGLGSVRLNNLIVKTLKDLQQFTSVVLVSGQGQYEELRRTMPEDSENFQLHAFVSTMPELLGAADVVVARAGATTILELAALKAATILVPNEALTGGHQIKNAAVYGEAQAAIVLDEEEIVRTPEVFVRSVKLYLGDKKTTKAMTERFGAFAKPHAAEEMAAMVLNAAR